MPGSRHQPGRWPFRGRWGAPPAAEGAHRLLWSAGSAPVAIASSRARSAGWLPGTRALRGTGRTDVNGSGISLGHPVGAS
jgi:hypothetical protein